MPPDLKRRLERAAKANRRSMNAELVIRLHGSLEGGGEPEKGGPEQSEQETLLKLYNRLSPRRRQALLELLASEK